jgi:hypothetical protein
MIIFNYEKFVFIHIPKNSGTEMSNQIQSIYNDSKLLMYVEREGPNIGIDKMHLYYQVISKFIDGNVLDNSIKFCIIRNPYNKIYSAWNYLKDRYSYNNFNEFVKYHLNEEFIYGLETIVSDARVHYRPQFTFIYDNGDKQYVDFIIRYEYLNDDIIKFNNLYNLNIPTYANDNINKDYINFFNLESIQKINSLYKKDFELLNYKMIES